MRDEHKLLMSSLIYTSNCLALYLYCSMQAHMLRKYTIIYTYTDSVETCISKNTFPFVRKNTPISTT